MDDTQADDIQITGAECDPFEITEVPAATRRHIRPELDDITGEDVLLTGKKLDGTPFRRRRLNNVSFDRTSRDGIVVRGADPGGGIRSFNLAQLTDMEVVR